MSKPAALKLGPLLFQPGVNGPNLTTMLFAAFGTMAIVSFMGFMQPYVLTELLRIPASQQGSITGNLHAFQEVLFICIAGLAGALSDKTGRPLPGFAPHFLTSPNTVNSATPGVIPDGAPTTTNRAAIPAVAGHSR